MALPLLARQLSSGVGLCRNLEGHRFLRVAFDERRELIFPSFATINMSFQQTKVRARADNSQAQSQLQAKRYSEGIYIITSGSTIHENGWAVSAPELKAVGEHARYRFGMKLYCISSSAAPNMHAGGCDVNVDVCYKPKK